VLSIGTAAYPALGGVLAGINWKLTFLQAALALPVGAAVALLIPKTEQTGEPSEPWRIPRKPATHSGPFLQFSTDDDRGTTEKHFGRNVLSATVWFSGMGKI
jgi:hypothetical protein